MNINNPTITLIDYHCGNLRSVEQAFNYCGASVVTTSEPDVILNSTKLILPGVGAFPRGIGNLKALNLVEPILHKVQQGTPILGICLGMQLLFTQSEEHGGADGLNLLKGKVKTIPTKSKKTKLPHIGWNKIDVVRFGRVLKQTDYYYFVHSFAAIPESPEVIVATTRFDENNLCAAVEQSHIWGVQFHPENSAQQGLDLISRYIAFPSKTE